MRVLLLHPDDPNQMFLMKSLCDHLNEVGVHTDMLNIKTHIFYSPSKNTFSFRRIDSLYSRLLRIPKIRVLARKYINYATLLCSWIVKHYDILDIQSLFSLDFVDIAKICHNKGLRIKTHIWGSDLFRETDDQKSWHEEIYKCSNTIQVATSKAVEYFSKVYPLYASRLVTIPYGLEQFDILDSMFASNKLIDDSFLVEQKGRLFITCGYNGRREQQHLLILAAIEKLPTELKQKIFLYLPMTYLLEEDYYNEIKGKLEDLHIPFQIQRNRLTLNQNLSMRMLTDIVVNIQTTDGLAASIQEHLYCGNVLLAGDWLPYDLFLDNGVYYYKTSLNKLAENLESIIYNYSGHKQRCLNNRRALHKLTSWQAIAPRWKTMYEEMMKRAY